MKYAVVTGSTKGIGKSIAKSLLKQGYFVVFHYGHDDSVIPELEKELKTISEKYTIIKNDFCDEDRIIDFCETINSFCPTIDVFINNVAITDFFSMSLEQWNKVLNINLTAPFLLTQKLGKKIVDNGNIIFIGSLLGNVPHSISVPYGVSKAGLHMLAKYLVKIFAENKIRVNVVAPGFVDTPWQINKPKEQRNRIENKIAMNRFAYPDEIADACNFIIHNGYINGSVLNIHGGYDFK